LSLQRIRDDEKRELCFKNNINLVVIPYWWDNSLDSLREMLPEQFKDDLKKEEL